MSNPIRAIMVKRRRELGLTQEEAAKKAGCNESTWCRWEGEKYMPRPGDWPRIAKVLGMTLAELQGAAAQTLNHMATATATEVRPAGEGGGSKTRPFVWVNKETRELYERVERIDLGKIEAAEAQYQMSHLRTSLINMAMAIDTQTRSIASLVELFEKQFLAKVSESRTRFKHPVKIKVVLNVERDQNGQLLHKDEVKQLVNSISATLARIREKPARIFKNAARELRQVAEKQEQGMNLGMIAEFHAEEDEDGDTPLVPPPRAPKKS